MGDFKLLSSQEDPVEAGLRGWALAHPGVITITEHGHVNRAVPKAQGKVALVIGNGTGHEPAMVGFVGTGMIDLNVPGPIFAAPDAKGLAAGVRSADRGAGVLLCVSHHQGDVLAAELAVELLEDEACDVAVQVVILGEDIGTPFENRHDRRGGAGLLFVWKLLGAFAEQGHDLATCTEFALRVAHSTASLSAIVGAGSHPITGESLADIPLGHVLVGSGVHGEGSGMEPLSSTEALVEMMIGRLAEDDVIANARRVGLVINNMGRLTGLELGCISHSAHRVLNAQSVHVDRTWFGQYATTQDSAGFAIALCAFDGEFLDLWDAPAETVSWVSS